MRLKRLELVGFKSFASRVKLDFDQGITAIVGPNGSGKSNISDAVRWVLGEQSMRSLRGAKLEDVIFAGADGKRALGMAEVQLTLDNVDGFLPVDYIEVTITRRVYRSGDSEFFINKRACRLKDVHELVTDTGLGREGYAIIGQGQIDAVLSANSHDRRVLLEETAGIVKYRNRKEQAQKKIQQTDLDLIRVTDILKELQHQLGPLEIEAKKARVYQKLANELRDYELDLFTLCFRELDVKRTNLKHQLGEKAAISDEVSTEFQQLELNISATQHAIASLEQQIEQGQNQLMEVNEQFNTAIHTMERIQERSGNNQKRQTELRAKSDTLQTMITQLFNSISEIEQILVREKQELQTSKVDFTTFECTLVDNRQTYHDSRTRLDMQKTHFLEFMRELADARNSGRNYQQEIAALTQQRHRNTEERDELLLQLKMIDQKITVTKTEQRLKQNEWEQFKESIHDHEILIRDQRNYMQASTKEEQVALSRYQQQQSRLTALTELDEDYDGYSYSVRKLMQEKESNMQLIGTVADVIKVPNGLETAFEIALGPALQNVITETHKGAEQAIEWLKHKRAGRATFLPLDTMKGSGFPASYSQFWETPRCLGPAIDLLVFDQRFRPALAALVGRVVVVEDLAAALMMQKQLPSFSRIVTKSGELIMPTGALTGGAINAKKSGLLTRKTEISKLSKEVEAIRVTVDQATATKDAALTELQTIEERAASLRHMSTQCQLIVLGLEKDLQQLHNEHDRIQRSIAEHNHSIEQIQISQSELEETIGKAQHKVAQLERDEIGQRDEMTKLEAMIQILEAQINKDNEELMQKKVNLTNLTRGVELTNTKLTANQQQLATNKAEIAALLQEIRSLEEQDQVLKATVVEQHHQRQTLANQREQATASLDQLKVERATEQARLNADNERFKKLRSAISALDKQTYAIELDLNQVDIERNRLLSDLNERAVVLEDLHALTPKKEKDELLELTNRLKQQIRGLGTINLGSLQEYEAVNERSFFLQTQVDDLREAKEALEAVICEMDITSKQKLKRTFEELRIEFQQIFRQLFQGGKADLVLTEPDDLLETGIDIIAQPPGKKPQNLLLLSGGERALTAIALLFSIRRVKPTPFCILDEIDAALDDANLHRFSQLMAEFSASTQFLVITHRQGTMEFADRLYGVTMNDTATSQLISVQLA